MKNYKKSGFAVMGLSAALLGGNVHAEVVVSNGVVTATGAHVTYTFNSAELELFGPVESVSISGDTLNFAPSSFSVSGFGLLEDTLLVNVSAHSGYQFSSFSLAESGSYTAGGIVDVDGMFDVRDNYAPNSNFVAAGIVESFGASNGWTAQTGNVLPLAGWGENGVFNSATLTITNTLFVGDATLSKDYVGISVVTTPVPEAQNYAMLLAGLGLVGFMARRARMIV